METVANAAASPLSAAMRYSSKAAVDEDGNAVVGQRVCG